VIVATHDHSVIERYGKRTIHLEGGRIADDSPGERAPL
jgi:ABC-type ATPase involved in cell division